MNAIDGSSVWTQSITLALAQVADVNVTLLLSHPTTNDRMLAPLRGHASIEIVEPATRGQDEDRRMTPDQAASWLRRTRAQIVVVRGTEAALRLAEEPALRGKIWPYLTDIPQRSQEVDTLSEEKMSTIMAASPLVLCQTEELRAFIEANFPPAAGKGVLFPPVVPGDIAPDVLSPPTKGGLNLCYAGKFARAWNTYEMCDLPKQLGERGIEARLTMVGDKINQDPSWPGFPAEMKQKLKTSPGVDWVGGVSREQSISHMASAHIGLSWRSHELDDSLELSTKLLEYCAAGTPPILNRTAMHERIFGMDYPFFVDSDHTVLDLLELVVEQSHVYEGALQRTSDIAADYTVEKASDRLAALVADQLDQEVSLMSRLRSRLRGGH